MEDTVGKLYLYGKLRLMVKVYGTALLTIITVRDIWMGPKNFVTVGIRLPVVVLLARCGGQKNRSVEAACAWNGLVTSL